MIEIQILPKADLAEWARLLHSTEPSMALGVLLSGDCWSCVSEAAVAKINGKIVCQGKMPTPVEIEGWLREAV